MPEEKASKNDANIDTMKAAVQQGIDDINCQLLQNHWTSNVEYLIIHPAACESLERMTEEGILTRADTPNYTSTKRGYLPTDEYLHEFKIKKNPLRSDSVMFCPGNPKVTEVTSFTVPAEKNGMKMSMVSFKWKVDLPQPIKKLYDAGVLRKGFSKSCGLFDPFSAGIKLEGSDSMPVVLTNNGWKPAKTFRLR